jgi:hypothetical protein
MNAAPTQITKPSVKQPVFTMKSMDALLDKLGEVLRQRDAAIRLGLTIAGDGSLEQQDIAFRELYAMREEITRQKHNQNNK